MGQVWDTQAYADHAHFVADLGEPLLESLAVQPGQHILDLGCGDGVLTVKLQALGAIVIGVDASPAMVTAAQQRGITARVLDAQALDYEAAFDAVFSNAALHWMTKPDLVLAGVWRALRPGGRFVGEFGGAGNIALVQAALTTALSQWDLDFDTLNPWYFPTPADYQARLSQNGFQVKAIQLIPRPTPIPSRMSDWLTTFAQTFLHLMPKPEQEAFLDTVVGLLQPDLLDASGQWWVDYVRLRFVAEKPEAV